MSRGKSKDEGADSYAAIVARLNENWRIIVCGAGIQWILQCRGEKYGGVRWRHRSFCRTSEALRRVVREHAGKIDPAAAAIFAGLPDGSRSSCRSGPDATSATSSCCDRLGPPDHCGLANAH